MRLRGWRADALVALGVTVLMLGPALLPAYVLRGDMVFVPHQPWKPEWLGWGEEYPRSVPMDALVSVLTYAVPGWVVQKVLLVGALLAGGIGIGRLVHLADPGHGGTARAAAVTFFLWNPYVAERLLIGQWALVLGYCVLPWVVVSTWRLVSEGVSFRRALLCAGAVLAGAVASPPSGLMALGTALVVALVARHWNVAAGVGAFGVVANLPWVVPALAADVVASSSQAVRRAEFAEFAARAESDAGLLPSLVSLGGIWKSSVVPGERTSGLVVAAAALLSVVAVTGLYVRARHGRRRRGALVGALAVLGALALLLAAAPAVPSLGRALADLSVSVPPVGLLRDSHRFLAPAALVLAVGLACVATALLDRVRPGLESLRAVAALLVIAPLLVLPSLAWGSTGDLRAVDYPREWETVAEILADDRRARVVVLPWAGSYRGFAWNDYRAVLDPAPRLLPARVTVDDRVLLEGVTVPYESPFAARVGAVVEGAESPAELADGLRGLGVRWVLVERGHRVPVEPLGVSRHTGRDLRLIDLGTGS